jgi:glycosyltransferase involved in cell wall biosynthesis
MRVVILTNFISPYQAPVLEALSARVKQLCVMVSTIMEPNRPWSPPTTQLHVVVQKTWTLSGLWRHPRGFQESLYVHLPLRTVRDLQRVRPEAIISVEMGARTLLALLYRLMNRGTVLLVWADVAESTEQGRGRLRWLARLIIRHSADLFVTNGCSGERYLRKLGVADYKIRRIPYGVDTTLFGRCPTARPKDRCHSLLFVGQLIERKGLLPFLSALNEWSGAHPDRSVSIEFVGDGPLRAALEKFPTNKNLRVQFHASVSYENTIHFYERAGILVFPTWADTWGVVVNEAMASGLPVLGSVYGQAVEELVTEGKTGWLFRPDNHEEMVAAIDRALQTTPDQLDEMRLQARAVAMAVTPERVADMITSALESAVAGRRTNPRVALLTNIVAPYRVPVYREIGRTLDLLVFTAGQEDNRPEWKDHVLSLKAKRSWGWTISKQHKIGGSVYDLSYLHITPGYLIDLIRAKPSAIITNEMGPRTCVALVYGLLRRIPVWVWWGGTKHTERARSIWRRVLRRALVRVVKHWISYGQTSTEYLVSIGVRADAVLQIQNCVDEAAYKAANRQPRENGPVRLLCVSQLLARKGVRELLCAFAEATQQCGGVTLTIVGDGPERLSLEALRDRLDVLNVSFAGRKTPGEILSYYAAADCFVFPTLEDVWGLVVNEAIWAGVPVISSKYAGCACEIVPEANIFDPLNHQDFVRALVRAARLEIAPVCKERLRTSASVGNQIATALSESLLHPV